MGLLEILMSAHKKGSSKDGGGSDEEPPSSEDVSSTAADEYAGDAFRALKDDDESAFKTAFSKAVKACMDSQDDEE